MNARIAGSFLVFSLVAPSVFPIPRKALATPRTNKALVAITKEALNLAKTNTQLKERLTPIVGSDTLGKNPTQLDLSKMPLATLEDVRDSLTKDERRKLMVKEFHNFFNPSTQNEKNGTVHYAELFKVLSETNNANDQEAAKFENDHKEFCKIFCANANTSVFNLSTCLKQAYSKIKDNDTKQAIKSELEDLGKKNKISLLLTVTRRINNNKTEA